MVYIVIPWYAFEGYDEPVAAFKTREAAEAKALELKDRYVEYEVFEFQVQD